MGTATTGPTMPVVTLTANEGPCPGETNIQYRFIVGNNGRALEYEDAPPNYDYPAPLDSGWLPAGQRTWDIVWGTGIYGGHITHVTIRIRKVGATDDLCSQTFQRDIWIIGGALPGTLRNAYIDTLTAYAADIRTMAKAIAIQESGGTHYWSGSPPGTASHLRYPLREEGGGGGYGVMQLTSLNLLTRESIWNWKQNIATAMAFIKQCYDTGAAYLATHPAGPPAVTARMRRLEGYDRYNGGLASRYHWWNPPNNPCTPPQGCGSMPAAGWVKFGYIPVGTSGTAALRDFNNDGVADCPGNPFCISPNGPSGPNVQYNSAERYADEAITKEP